MPFLSKCLVGGLCVITLTACSSFHQKSAKKDGPPLHKVDVSQIKNATPTDEAPSRYGNPLSYNVNGKTYHVMQSSDGYKKEGVASWYGRKFHDKRASSGETYDLAGMTAAHKTLPLPTYVRVTNLENNHSVVVKVNDRGPFKEDRIIDLSYAAAVKLNMLQEGTALVRVEAIEPSPTASPTTTQSQTATERHFYLQAGAFRMTSHAKKIKARLAKLSPFPITITTEKHGLHKVLVGPITDRQAAEALQRKIQQAGFPRPFAFLG